MNLKRSMELAGRNLLNCLCPTRNYQPYWAMRMDEEYRAEMAWFGNIHNIGRWWDAMLRLEDATGFSIPAHIEGTMLENLYESFDNPDNLCLPHLDVEWMKPALDFHSLRESLLALNALVRYRGSRWAAGQGHQMLETLLRISRADSSWDLDKIDYYHRIGKPDVSSEPNVSTNGRLIEALVWFYEATGDALALTLADRYARYHLENTTRPDGEFNNASNPTHTHSYLGTLRGLLLFGRLTNQREYIDRVAATYRVTVPKLVLESGFACHDLWKDNPNRGEVGSTGDATQLALWLALYAGHTEYLDDAERIVRARLIPGQITESPILRPTKDDGDDEHVNLNERIIGGIGGMQREPHAGKKNTTDVTAAVLHGLVDIYNHISVRTDAGLAVYFHFDYEDANVRISSERTEEAKVKILPKERENVLIRIPRWAPRESVQLTVNSGRISPVILGDFVHVPGETPPGEIVLRYALPIHKSVEKVGEVELEYTWRGDEIIGVCPNSEFFPFYPIAKGCA